MLFNVPQFIDVEDKVAGPFTAKQLLWMFGMGAMLLVLWNVFEKSAFFVSAIPVIIIFIALAFYRPYNQPLIRFIFSALLFLFKPKVYVWRRTFHKIHPKSAKKEAATAKKKDKSLSEEDLTALAQMLDSEGQKRNKRITEIMKEREQKKQS